MKFKSFKNKKLIQIGMVELVCGDDTITIPIKSLSVTDERDIYIDSVIAIPYKDEIPNEAEKEYLQKNDPKYNSKKYPMIRRYDIESIEYKKAQAELDKYSRILNVIKYVDMDFVIEDGVTLWDDLGIEKGNWLGVCKFFGDELKLRDSDLETILVEAKRLRGDSMYEKMSVLQRATGLDMLEILDIAAKHRLEKEAEITDIISENKGE